MEFTKGGEISLIINLETISVESMVREYDDETEVILREYSNSDRFIALVKIP